MSYHWGLNHSLRSTALVKVCISVKFINVLSWNSWQKLQDCHYAVWFSFDHQDIWGSWECSWPFWMRPKQENYPQIKKQQCWFWGLSWDPWKTSITDSTFKRDKLEAQLNHEVALNICNKCNRKRGHSGVVCNTASLQEGPGFKSSLPVYTWDVPVMIC